MKLTFYPETCCDWCNEVWHNHFDCPACKTPNASTDVFDSLTDSLKVGDSFKCECGAQFKLVTKGESWDYDNWEFEQVKPR